MKRLTFACLAPLALVAATATPLAAEEKKSGGGQEFTRKFFSGKDFDDGKILEAKFFQVRMNGANFSDMTIENTTFEQCDLAGADFEEAVFKGACKFYRVTMNGADLEEADFGGATFDSVNFRGANLSETKNFGSVNRVNFDGADLSGADLSGISGSMEDIRWEGALYDDETKFPKGIDPKAVGAVMK